MLYSLVLEMSSRGQIQLSNCQDFFELSPILKMFKKAITVFCSSTPQEHFLLLFICLIYTVPSSGGLKGGTQKGINNNNNMLLKVRRAPHGSVEANIAPALTGQIRRINPGLEVQGW